MGLQENESKNKVSGQNKSMQNKINNFSYRFNLFIQEIYKSEFTPEQVFYYIYAILYSPSYRLKYAEFLKIDFPRIPFTLSGVLFSQISDKGHNLINAHLFESEILKQITMDYHIGDFKGQGSFNIEKIQFIENKVYINITQYFDNISEKVYNFQIGGYQILYKYLKDSKEMVLGLRDIEKIENIIRVLAFTIDTMKDIDLLFNELIMI